MKSHKRLLYISLSGFVLTAASFLLMPVNAMEPGVTPVRIITTIMFWSGLIIGVTCQVMLAKRLKKPIRENERAAKRRVGALCFLSNRYASAADLLLALSFIALIISLFAESAFGYFNFIIRSVLVLSLSGHCILNGRMYYYINHNQKRGANNEENV